MSGKRNVSVYRGYELANALYFCARIFIVHEYISLICRPFDSSPFEHVFDGETKCGKVIRFHNWLTFWIMERKKFVDYYGFSRCRKFLHRYICMHKLLQHWLLIFFTYSRGTMNPPLSILSVPLYTAQSKRPLGQSSLEPQLNTRWASTWSSSWRSRRSSLKCSAGQPAQCNWGAIICPYSAMPSLATPWDLVMWSS